ncbi:hypothetical protein UlMin_014029 [Ulmus minor]
MLASSDFSELSGQNPGRLLEKSNLSQRCSMLSQYLKENGSFRDISLGMTCNNDPSDKNQFLILMFLSTSTTMNLFPITEKSRNMETPRDFGFINFFPPNGGFSSSIPQAETLNVADYSLNKPVRAPMTIFYAGQVLVFNDLLEDKAKEKRKEKEKKKNVNALKNITCESCKRKKKKFTPGIKLLKPKEFKDL